MNNKSKGERVIRNNIQESVLLNNVFLACAQIIKEDIIHTENFKNIEKICDSIPSKSVSDFLKSALELIEYAYVPEYIDILLRIEYEKIDKSKVTEEELKTLVILMSLLTKLFQKKDFTLFFQFYSHECPSHIRDKISMMLQHDNK